MTDNFKADDDTISLASFKQAVKDILRFFLNAISWFFLAIRRNAGMFILCSLLGLGLAYAYYNIKPAYYETEMIVQQHSLTRKAYSEVLSNLDNLIRSKSYPDLAQALGVPEASAKKIISIKTMSLVNESLERDTSTRLGLPFKIQVRVKDNSVAPPLQKGLVDYLNNNAYVKKVREGRKQVFIRKLAFIDMEQQKLDSLKDTYNRTLASMNMPSTFYNNSIDPSELYRHSLDLENQREAISNWLITDGEGILLIDSFKSPDNPQSVSLAKTLIIGLLAGMGLGILLSLFSFARQRLG